MHEPVRIPETARGGVIAGALIAPGAVVGVLHHWQQLQMGVAHIPDVGNKLGGDFVPGVKGAVLVAPPGAQMHLIDVPGALQGPAGTHPLAVPPGVSKLPHLRGRARPGFGGKAVGVSLPAADAVGPLYYIFIQTALSRLGHDAPPEPAVLPPQGPAGAVPGAEIPGDGHAAGIGGPHAEFRPRGGEMSAQHRPGVVKPALAEGSQSVLALVHERPSFDLSSIKIIIAQFPCREKAFRRRKRRCFPSTRSRGGQPSENLYRMGKKL